MPDAEIVKLFWVKAWSQELQHNIKTDRLYEFKRETKVRMT